MAETGLPENRSRPGLLPWGVLAAVWTVGVAGCIGTATTGSNGTGQTGSARRTFPLDQLRTANITVDQSTFRVWLALSPAQQEEGLMHVSAREIADDQGMLFVFSDEEPRFFWMKDTITALDIAYARADGTIVQTWTMPPLTLRTFPSIEPAMFALEVKAGTFERLGIREGDRMVIPDEVFKAAP